MVEAEAVYDKVSESSLKGLGCLHPEPVHERQMSRDGFNLGEV